METNKKRRREETDSPVLMNRSGQTSAAMSVGFETSPVAKRKCPQLTVTDVIRKHSVVHDMQHTNIDMNVMKVYEFAAINQSSSGIVMAYNEQHAEFFKVALDQNISFIFLTGIPGSGKSTIVSTVRNYIMDRLTKEPVMRNPAVVNSLAEKAGYSEAKRKKMTINDIVHHIVVTLAPTGVAASCIPGALTFDSFFAGCKMQQGTFTSMSQIPHWVASKVKLTSVLFIDEISMLHCTKFQNADMVFRIVRNKMDQFFGGIKVFISGDFQQLKPVYDKRDAITTIGRQILSGGTPHAFQTNTWIKEQRTKGFYSVILTHSFRQDPTQQEFMDLLRAIRTGLLEAKHHEMLESRIVSFEQFRDQASADNIVVTPVFRSRPAVNHFNEQILASLRSPEYQYMSAYIASRRTLEQLKIELHSHCITTQLKKTEAKEFTYVGFGKVMDGLFNMKPNPCSTIHRNALVPTGQDSFENLHSGYYFDRSVLTIQDVLRSAQAEADNLGRALVCTKLKVGANISLTKNLDQPLKIINGTVGVVVDFMTVRHFMNLKGTSVTTSGLLISEKVDVTMGELKIGRSLDEQDDVMVDDQKGDLTLTSSSIVKWGFVSKETNATLNANAEKFPLVALRGAGAKYILLLPVLSEVETVSASRNESNARQLTSNLYRASADYIPYQPAASSNIANQSTSTQLDLIRIAQARMDAEEADKKKKVRIYALHIPACLSWATTIYAVQGLTLEAAWLGEIPQQMDPGAFYVFMSRVSRLDRIGWISNPCSLCKSSPEVVEFEEQLVKQKTLRAIF